MNEPSLRLLCLEGQFNDLLGDLALHKLDIVISDKPAPTSPNIKLYSHALGSSSVAWYGKPSLVQTAQHEFPKCLATLPVLLTTTHTASRDRLDQWFSQLGIRPRIVGEFEDSALLKTFGSNGLGVFPAAEWINKELLSHYGLERLGACDGVVEHFYGIGTEKRVQHPLVEQLLKSSI
jgi:LysR family transcriptional activator of nhaA